MFHTEMIGRSERIKLSALSPPERSLCLACFEMHETATFKPRQTRDSLRANQIKLPRLYNASNGNKHLELSADHVERRGQCHVTSRGTHSKQINSCRLTPVV